MGEAALEILILLIIAGAIGMVFTWLYWRKKYNALQTDYNLLTQEKSKVEQENKALNQQVQALNEDVKSKESDIETLKSVATSKDEQIAALKSELLSKEDAIGQVKMEHKELSKSKDLVEKEITQIKNDLQKKKEENEVLKNKLSKGNDRPKSYYKIIDGVKYKALTLKVADDAVAGKGDGRISKVDAEKIFDTISDGNQYTDVEKATMKRLRDYYNWTEEADELFRHHVRVWAANDHHIE